MTWIQTYTGLALDLFDPQPEQIALEDIAHALALQCRFNGHVRRFYSVAEHSALVAAALEERGEPVEIQRLGLMHDAAEAYVGDMVAPLKRSPGLERYTAVEHGIWLAICSRFGLSAHLPSVVKLVDVCMLAREADELLGPRPRDWELPDWAHPEPLPDGWPLGLSPLDAEIAFHFAARKLGL